jgi:hypothetical protein
MNILVTPPEQHFDKGLGISAWHFRDAAKALQKNENNKELVSPICYIQRHAIELYLKSLIYILHKKYNIPFGDGFSLEKPAICVNGKWKLLANTHNLADLYSYFLLIFNDCSDLLPETTDWTLDAELTAQINLISGFDPTSTYFRYPEATNRQQDLKKATVQPIDLGDNLEKFHPTTDSPIKCSVMLDSNDNIVATYDLEPNPIEHVRSALDKAIDYINNLHCAFMGELTKWS